MKGNKEFVQTIYELCRYTPSLYAMLITLTKKIMKGRRGNMKRADFHADLKMNVLKLKPFSISV